MIVLKYWLVIRAIPQLQSIILSTDLNVYEITVAIGVNQRKCRPSVSGTTFIYVGVGAHTVYNTVHKQLKLIRLRLPPSYVYASIYVHNTLIWAAMLLCLFAYSLINLPFGKGKLSLRDGLETLYIPYSLNLLIVQYCTLQPVFYSALLYPTYCTVLCSTHSTILYST